MTHRFHTLHMFCLFQALDSGVMSSLDDFTRVCQPKLVVFDLNTDRVVRTVLLPNEVLRPSSLLTNLVVDENIQGRCDSAFVYMTDTASPGKYSYLSKFMKYCQIH